MAVFETETRKNTSHGWRSPLSTPIERNKNSSQDLFQHLEKLIASTVSICRLKGSLECQTGGLITVSEELQRLVRFAVSEISRVERDLKRHKANCEDEISCLKDQVRSLEEERDILKKQVHQFNKSNGESSGADNRFLLEGRSGSSNNVTEKVESDIDLFDHLECEHEDVQSQSKRLLQSRKQPKNSKKMHKTEKTKILKKKAAGKSVIPRKHYASNFTCDVQHDQQSSENTEDLLDLVEQEEEKDHHEQSKSKITPESRKSREKGNRTRKPFKIDAHDEEKNSHHPENALSHHLDDEDISIEQESKEDEKMPTNEIRKKKNKKESKARADDLLGKKKRSVRKKRSSEDQSEKETVPSQKQIVDNDDGDDDNGNNDDGTIGGDGVGNNDGGTSGVDGDGENDNDDNGNGGEGDDGGTSGGDGVGNNDGGTSGGDGVGNNDGGTSSGDGDGENGNGGKGNDGGNNDDGSESGEKLLSKARVVLSKVKTTPKAKFNEKSKLMLTNSHTKTTPKGDDEPLGDLSFLIDVNSRISDFVNSNNKELELPPMTSRQRSDVHKLTKLYNVRGRFGSKTDSGTSMILLKGAQTKQPRAGKVDALLSELSIAASKETTPKAKRKRNSVSNLEESDKHRAAEEDNEDFEETERDMRPRKKRKPRQ